jgi:broad specificity phosphatase PhoE
MRATYDKRSALMAPRRILIARHGQTAWNALGKLQGHTDIALDETGRAQAKTLAGVVMASGIGAVWTSDLSRARETGEIVAAALGLAVPRTDAGLRERKFGIFEGLTRDECAQRHPEHWSAWQSHTTAPPGGEPREVAVARMGATLARIASATETDGAVLVISHGGLMRLWLMELLARSVPLIPNGIAYSVDHHHDETGPRFVPIVVP